LFFFHCGSFTIFWPAITLFCRGFSPPGTPSDPMLILLPPFFSVREFFIFFPVPLPFPQDPSDTTPLFLIRGWKSNPSRIHSPDWTFRASLTPFSSFPRSQVRSPLLSSSFKSVPLLTLGGNIFSTMRQPYSFLTGGPLPQAWPPFSFVHLFLICQKHLIRAIVDSFPFFPSPAGKFPPPIPHPGLLGPLKVPRLISPQIFAPWQCKDVLLFSFSGIRLDDRPSYRTFFAPSEDFGSD